ncbi:MAG: DJ-1/PfpI family protein [Coriobacteriaceae bacterium]|nr:DJ-1/PfpI family protein [Coriobacteriaceae bacterium]
MKELSDKKVAIVIAPEFFRDEEYAQPHASLNLAKADITTVSRAVGKCYGSRGSVVHARMTLEDAAKQDWDAVVFVGGAGSETYIDDPVAHALALRTNERGKLVAAICKAPCILAHAGLLRGAEATSFVDDQDDLRKHGVKVSTSPVVETEVNGAPVITANGPQAAFAFGQALVNNLRGPYDPFGLSAF